MSAKQKLVSPPSGGGTILDEESYKTLSAMFKSGDEANISMAQVMLTQCNVKESIYWIWKLSRNVYVHNMVNLRTKLGRQFRDDTNLFYICSATGGRFTSWLKRKDWLTPWIWAQFKDEIRRGHQSTYTNEFFEVTLTLKPEYEAYNIDPQQLKLVEDGNQST